MTIQRRKQNTLSHDENQREECQRSVFIQEQCKIIYAMCFTVLICPFSATASK